MPSLATYILKKRVPSLATFVHRRAELGCLVVLNLFFRLAPFILLGQLQSGLLLTIILAPAERCFCILDGIASKETFSPLKDILCYVAIFSGASAGVAYSSHFSMFWVGQTGHVKFWHEV